MDRTDAPEGATRTRQWIAMALIVLLGIVVYGRCVTFDYTLYDDPQVIFDNPQVMAGLTLDGIYWAFTNPNFGLYMPLPTLTFMLDRTLFGDWTGGYHGMTLFWHLLCACVFFQVMLRLTGNFAAVLAASLLVTVHPIQAMVVNQIHIRNEIMPAFFMLLSIEAYRRYALRRSWTGYGCSLVFMLLALLCKQGVVALPMVLLLLDYWPLNRIALSFSAPLAGLRRAAALTLEKAPWFALSLVGVCFAFFGKADVNAFADEKLTRPLENVGFALTAYARYLGHLVYPLRYVFAYTDTGAQPAWWAIAGSVLLLGAISGLALALVRRQPYVLVGWGWFVLLLLPVSGLVRYASESIALRYLYAPAMGLYLALAFGLYSLAHARKTAPQAPVKARGKGGKTPTETPAFVPAPWYWPVVGVVTAAAAVVCFYQSGFWRDSETLAQRALVVSNGANVMAHNHLGVIRHRQGLFEQALAHAREAFRLDPNRRIWRINYAVALNRRQRYAETIEVLAGLNEEAPDSLHFLSLYGGALLGLGRIEEATPYLERAIAIEPDYVPPRFNLCLALLESGRPDAMRPHLEHILTIQPEYQDARALLEQVNAGAFDDGSASLNF